MIKHKNARPEPGRAFMIYGEIYNSIRYRYNSCLRVLGGQSGQFSIDVTGQFPQQPRV